MIGHVVLVRVLVLNSYPKQIGPGGYNNLQSGKLLENRFHPYLEHRKLPSLRSDSRSGHIGLSEIGLMKHKSTFNLAIALDENIAT
jgi:hypothetical protein